MSVDNELLVTRDRQLPVHLHLAVNISTLNGLADTRRRLYSDTRLIPHAVYISFGLKTCS